MRQQIDELLHRKMDRRDFLKHLGVGTLALFGLGAAIKAVVSLSERQVAQKPAGQTQAATAKNALSYGAGTYGGKPQS